MHSYNTIMKSKSCQQDIKEAQSLFNKAGYNITRLNTYINWREFCDYKGVLWLPVCSKLFNEMSTLVNDGQLQLILE